MEQLIYASPSQYQLLLENYASIVEKTNQQLSLWSNPYGIMIGILTIFVALITIVVAWYIWKNSNEQKLLFKESLMNYQSSLGEQAKLYIEQKKEEIEKTILEIEKLKKSVAEEKRSEFDKLINEYKKEKEEIYNEPVTIQSEDFVTATSFDLLRKQDPTIGINCSNCGKFFKYKTSENLYRLNIGRQFVRCPKCKTNNYIS